MINEQLDPDTLLLVALVFGLWAVLVTVVLINWKDLLVNNRLFFNEYIISDNYVKVLLGKRIIKELKSNHSRYLQKQKRIKKKNFYKKKKGIIYYTLFIEERKKKVDIV